MDRLPAPVRLLLALAPDGEPRYGAWSGEGSADSLESARAALAERVCALLPPPPAELLHLDCGLGALSRRLAERGYRVTAVASDPQVVDYARSRRARPGLSFMTGEIGGERTDGVPSGAFDAVLLFDAGTAAAAGLAAARRALRDGGVVVLAGEIASGRTAGAGPPPTAADITIALAENGFRPVERVGLGVEVAPTCAAMVAHVEAAAARGGAVAVETAAALDLWRRRATGFACGELGYELVAARKDPYSMRPYRPGDEVEIVAMFREVFGVERTLDHWRWKYDRSPFGRHLIVETVAGDGTLVAHYAGYPVPFYSAAHGGHEFMTHQIGDTMTRPAVRQAGLGRTGILARMAAYYYARFAPDIPFAFGFNTGHIRKLGERYLQYEYIDPVGFWVRAARRPSSRRSGRVASWLAGYRVAEITEAGPELDGFFRRVRDAYGLLVRRDAAWVRWRYLDCPDRVHRLFAVRRRGDLLGWCAFSRRGADLVWGDALFDHRHVAAAALVLDHAAATAFPGVERIWGWFSPHPAWWTEALASLGFVRERDPNDLTPGFYFFGRSEQRSELAAAWYYCYGDGDLF